jgi:GxxExxY protein
MVCCCYGSLLSSNWEEASVTEIIYPELSYVVQGIYMDVYRELQSGLREELYEEAMTRDLERERLSPDRQKPFPVFYKDTQVGLYYPDLIVADRILLELKAQPELTPLHVAQVISYLKVTGYKLGILMNFGCDWFDYQRIPNYVSDKVSTAPPEVPLRDDDGWLYPQLIHDLLGALYEVHRTLGPGFLHHVYRRAIWAELQLRRLPVASVKRIEVTYRGELIGHQECRLLVVDDKVLVAAVALGSINEAERRKFKMYLKRLGLQIGLLANFHDVSLQPEVIRVSKRNNEREN